jgi:quercetin dioxygenase-like cupin family protein
MMAGRKMNTMQTYNWDSIEKEQMNPFLRRQVIHGDNMTIARLEIAKGCNVPQHSHVNEQIAMVQSGRVLFNIGGVETTIGAGETIRIPPNVPHFVDVIEDCIVFDLFSPRREDWIRGDDAYLRTK